jgi:deazaflavin-dependent oxidoreductase (nitroreductase family)
MTTANERRWLRFPYVVINPVFRFLLVRCGLGSGEDQDSLRILRVRGRKSGRVYELPVRLAVFNDQRYIVSMLGDTEWVRNLRAVGTAHIIVGKQVEHILATEIQGAQKAAFLLWYCLHPLYELRARYGLKANTKNLTPAEVDRLSRLYAVFRLEYARSPEKDGPAGS